MICYNCGCSLSEHDFCTACGADVSLYKRIMHISNMYYNEGLEKAGVRDLSGAIVSLRQSLKFNKNNVDARNLLGLVYFEMGEAVAALSEWVISKNLKPEKNIADDYIEVVQSSASRLDMLNQTIKKYNQAYNYCLQGSKDLAVIQLKKVLSMNPRQIQAHQLLALLYIDSEQWEKAKRELKKCLEVDKNNTLALRYLKEVDLVLMPEDGVKGTIKKKNDDAVRYQSDNEIIIQPLNVKENKRSGWTGLLNIALGIIIGVAAMYFLVLPSRVTEVKNEANIKIAEIGNQLDDKTATITELEKQVEQLKNEADSLNQELEGYVGTDGTLSMIGDLLGISSSYLKDGDDIQTLKDLETLAAELDITLMSEEFQKLYNALYATAAVKAAVIYYDEGKASYNSGKYPEAISSLSEAVKYDATHVDALYFLAHAYRKNGDRESANKAFNKVIELFPGTNRANSSKSYITN